MKEERKQYNYDRLALLIEAMSGKNVVVLDDGEGFKSMSKESEVLLCQSI